MQKKKKFALEDDDDEQPTELLTHGGNALSTFDDFKDDISIESDGDDDGCMFFILHVMLCHFVLILFFLLALLYFHQKMTQLPRDCDIGAGRVYVVGLQ